MLFVVFNSSILQNMNSYTGSFMVFLVYFHSFSIVLFEAKHVLDSYVSCLH